MTKAQKGRRAIFRGKVRRLRVQGILSPRGMRAFNAARRRLAVHAKWPIARVSDADTIEYLAYLACGDAIAIDE